jgi:hypothetical protein
MPSVFGEIGSKIEGWYKPICASFRKLCGKVLKQ